MLTRKPAFPPFTMQSMTPSFIRNLIPTREKREDGRPLLQVLAKLTWLQWALFFSGYSGPRILYQFI
jgi:hypothetical protein